MRFVLLLYFLNVFTNLRLPYSIPVGLIAFQCIRLYIGYTCMQKQAKQ